MTADTREALAACPFCGEASDLEVDNSDHNRSTWVICHGCGARGAIMLSYEQAVKAWNARAAPATQPAQPSAQGEAVAWRTALNVAKGYLLQSSPCAAEDCKAEQVEWKEEAIACIDRALASAPAAPAQAVPPVLFDGFAVLNALDKKAQSRTSAENVSDVLDAVVRLLRGKAAP